MDLREAIYSRRAVRDYTPDPIGRDTVARLTQAAVQAPSAVNEQPWSFAVVQGRDLLERISREAKDLVLSAPPARLQGEILQRLRQPSFNIFYNAPALIVICSQTQGPWAIANCSLAAQNLMLAACAEGLGTCWIGFAEAWLQTPAGKAMLGLPSACLPVAPIIVGHPHTTPPAVSRREPVIHWIGSS